MLHALILGLHIAATPLPTDDIIAREKETRKMMSDEDAFRDILSQWKGSPFAPWDGESKGIYAD